MGGDIFCNCTIYLGGFEDTKVVDWGSGIANCPFESTRLINNLIFPKDFVCNTGIVWAVSTPAVDLSKTTISSIPEVFLSRCETNYVIFPNVVSFNSGYGALAGNQYIKNIFFSFGSAPVSIGFGGRSFYNTVGGNVNLFKA
jgi:hypothetical protein